MDILIKIGELKGFELTTDAHYSEQCADDNVQSGWSGDAVLTLNGNTYRGHIQYCGEAVVLEMDDVGIAALSFNEVPHCII